MLHPSTSSRRAVPRRPASRGPLRHPAAALLAVAAGSTSLAVVAMTGAATAKTGAADPRSTASDTVLRTSATRAEPEPWQVNTSHAPDRDALFETFYPGGRITLRRGGPDRPPRLAPGLHLRDGAPEATAMHPNGPTANRINLVFVGDGYTKDDQAVFDASAERAWQALASYEPYKTYQHFFGTWRVNLVSPTAGISNDPADGAPRATPLGMHFWCHGIDRLLCVDTGAASTYGGLFRGGVSHVIALAHTTTYGGAGGSITTLAGENPDSDAVVVHEMAHTIGGLGDEYQSSLVPAPGPAGADAAANVESASQEEMMRTHRSKWYRWLGRPSADGGVVGAYEGANYLDKGFYRPSPDSEMRTLGRPFNPPSIEALIKAFYVSRTGRGSIDPIDAVAPAPAPRGITDRGQMLRVELVPLVGRDYTVYWAVDGVSVPGSFGRTTLDLADAPLKKGVWNRVAVWVIDENPAVLDEGFRLRHMTKSCAWWVWGG